VKAEASFVKLPAKAKFAEAPVVVSFQMEPLLRVTMPVYVIVLTVPLVEPKFIVPEILVAPSIVIERRIVAVPPLLIVKEPNVMVPPLVVNVAPELTVTEPAAVWVNIAEIFTAPAPVVAIMTASPAEGTTPPIHVPPAFQFPPAGVLVIVAPCANDTVRNSIIILRTLNECICLIY
jgi:hypothetical protein